MNVAMKSTSTVECYLNSIYGIIRADLEARHCKDAIKFGIAVGDLIGTAYTYVCVGVLEGKVWIPRTGTDLYRLISHKAALMVKDAARSANCEHGRRSLRPLRSLDEVPGEEGRALIEHASYQRYMDSRRDEEVEFRRGIAVQTLYKVLEKMGMTEVNRNIYLECVVDEIPREVVAAKYGTTRGNADVIIARVKKALAKYGPAIFRDLCHEAA